MALTRTVIGRLTGTPSANSQAAPASLGWPERRTVNVICDLTSPHSFLSFENRPAGRHSITSSVCEPAGEVPIRLIITAIADYAAETTERRVALV
jgi:hypothetical protein